MKRWRWRNAPSDGDGHPAYQQPHKFTLLSNGETIILDQDYQASGDEK